MSSELHKSPTIAEPPPAAAPTDRPAPSMRFLSPAVFRLAGALRPGMRVLDVGCGRGHLAASFAEQGCVVAGVDRREGSIQRARARCPEGSFYAESIGPDLIEAIGEEPFDVVVSTEVVEHLYAPRDWAVCCYRALRPGGVLIASTPYHGYLKNLVLALSGTMDRHFHSLYDGGHIKFWSKRTLRILLEEQGFDVRRFVGVGRAPGLWRSMVVQAVRPS